MTSRLFPLRFIVAFGVVSMLAAAALVSARRRGVGYGTFTTYGLA